MCAGHGSSRRRTESSVDVSVPRDDHVADVDVTHAKLGINSMLGFPIIVEGCVTEDGDET